MSLYKNIRNTWNENSDEFKTMWRARLVEWRKEESSQRIDYPTRLDRARAIGYKAKPGIIVVRQRVPRGGHSRTHYLGGRHSSNQTKKLNMTRNYQAIAEVRANKEYTNTEVLGSYYVAQDGTHYWFEVILVDKMHPAILSDPRLSWVAKPAHTSRAFRGLTSASRKSRGLRKKGKGSEE